jgi:hypothetical protein
VEADSCVLLEVVREREKRRPARPRAVRDELQGRSEEPRARRLPSAGGRRWDAGAAPEVWREGGPARPLDVDGDAGDVDPDCPQHGNDKLVAEQGEGRAQDAGTDGSRRPRNRAGVRRSTVSAA